MTNKEKLIEVANRSVEKGGCLIDNTHFDAGYFHSNKYYFLKNLFQDTKYINDIVNIVKDELEQDLLYTFIGLHSYTSSILNKLILNFPKSNYALIEIDQNGSGFTFEPEIINDNIIVVLPISVTFKNANSIFKLLMDKNNVDLNNIRFFSIFNIFHQDLNNITRKKIIVKKYFSESHFYNKSNLLWKNIHSINNEINEVDLEIDSYIIKIKTLISLFFEIYLEIFCDLCFEKNQVVFSIKNTEVPNLMVGNDEYKIHDYEKNKLEKLKSHNNRSYQFQYVSIGNETFNTFINANIYYINNKIDILNYFKSELEKIVEFDDSHKIVIFTTENAKNYSYFINDFINKIHEELPDIKIKVFKIFNSKLQTENLLSIYKQYTNDQNKIIYFEDVLTNSRTLNTIENSFDIDAIFTLVDRRPKQKVGNVRKVYSYSNLPFPNLFTYGVENSFERISKNLDKILLSCNLDITKSEIINEIKKNKPLPPHMGKIYYPNKKIYLESHLKVFDNLEFKLVKESINNILYFEENDIDVLKLAIFRKICLYITNDEFYKNFKIENLLASFEIDDDIKKILKEISKKNDFEFDRNSKKYVNRIIIKFLCNEPFSRNNRLKKSVGNYVKSELEKLISLYTLNEETYKYFYFEELRYFIKRSVELNINTILSREFLISLKNLYFQDRKNKFIEKYEVMVSNLENFVTQISSNNDFSKDEVITFCKNRISFLDKRKIRILDFPGFLNRNIKTLISNKISKSIHFEKNIKDLCIFNNHLDLQNDYNQMIGVLTVENTVCLEEGLNKICNNSNNDPNLYDITEIVGKLRSPNFDYKELYNLPCFEFIQQSKFKLGTQENKNLMIAYSALLQGVYDLANVQNKTFSDVLKNLSPLFKSIFDSEKQKIAFHLIVDYSREENLNDDFYFYSDSYGGNTFESITKLSKNGLFYNLIHGLYSNMNIQSFLTLTKSNNTWMSFASQFRKFGDITDSELIDLIKLDQNTSIIKDVFNETELIYALRISDIVGKNNFDSTTLSLMGHGLFIITFKNTDFTNKKLPLIEDEKIRIVLLLKKYFTYFLLNKLNSGAFIDVIGRIKFTNYEEKLKHDIGTKLNLMQNVFNHVNTYNLYKFYLKYFTIRSFESNFEIFSILTSIVNSQINADTLIKVDIEIYKTDKLKKFIEGLFLSKYYGNEISLKRIEIKLYSSLVDLHPLIVKVVIPEIIYNIKKYVSNDDSIISITIGSEAIQFENRYHQMERSQKISNGVGLLMCERILENLFMRKLEIIDDNIDFFKIKIYLK